MSLVTSDRGPRPGPLRPRGSATTRPVLAISQSASRRKRLSALAGQGFLLAVTSASLLAVLFIFYFIIRDAWPFFQERGWQELVTSTEWYPSGRPPSFGALALFVGSALVTLGAVVVAVPLGISAAVCLSDVLPFGARQLVKPVIEMLAAIPSVAYGFFALVVLAPLLQEKGGTLLAVSVWVAGAPVAAVTVVVVSDLAAAGFTGRLRRAVALAVGAALGVLAFSALSWLGGTLRNVTIASGTNALNASLILGIMALPTVVSVSEDALTAVGRELREGSYALGATRAETVLRVVIPAARSGLLAAVILGVMRAAGETMVVWMASGNAAHIPQPWYNILQPIRTLTATIAGDMGEADQVVGSARFHVLFVLALVLLTFCFLCNLVSEWAIRRSKARSA
jgi:phosphate transport system permease protein